MPQRLLTGARPTGGLHIGQYFAAFKPFVESELLAGSLFVVSDLHMLTTKFTKEATDGLADAARGLVAEAIGFGVDPETTSLYVQSRVPWQARIYAVLQSLAPIDALLKMPSFEEMSRHSAGGRPPTLGLLGYPVLESSDVISVGASHVTIGENNRAHFELLELVLRELEETWGLEIQRPETLIGRKNLVGLDGSEKMSKSAGNAIFLRDGVDLVREKVRRMAPLGEHGEAVPTEYLRMLGATCDRCDEVREQVERSQVVADDVADEITELVMHVLRPIQLRIAEVTADPGYVDAVLREGTALANELAEPRYTQLATAIGLPRLPDTGA
jgi:tryptophanyl-tRNA synthetase